MATTSINKILENIPCVFATHYDLDFAAYYEQTHLGWFQIIGHSLSSTKVEYKELDSEPKNNLIKLDSLYESAVRRAEQCL